MEVLKAIKKRRSIRSFKNKMLNEEIVNTLIEALMWAPSSGNTQCRKFYFIFCAKTKNELAKAASGQNFIAQAPLAIVCCLDKKIKNYYGDRGLHLYSICDVSASIQNLLLVATSLSLGSCWVGAFNEDNVKKILKLKENLRPIAIIPVGYTAENSSFVPRVAACQAVVYVR